MGFFKFIMSDWEAIIFNKISLKIYENEQKQTKKRLVSEKNRIIRNNRIIVKVNDDIIYDSKKQKDISDDLYFALVSYGLKDRIKNEKGPINYSISSSISSLPMFKEMQDVSV